MKFGPQVVDILNTFIAGGMSLQVVEQDVAKSQDSVTEQAVVDEKVPVWIETREVRRPSTFSVSVYVV